MRNFFTHFPLRFSILLCALVSLSFNAVAQSKGKSKISKACYTKLEYLPPAGLATGNEVNDSLINIELLVKTTNVQDPKKSRFTLANKNGVSNGLRTSGKPSSCSTEVTVYNALGVIQPTNTWFLHQYGEDFSGLVVMLSGLPKGKYKISVKTSSGVEEFEVASEK